MGSCMTTRRNNMSWIWILGIIFLGGSLLGGCSSMSGTAGPGKDPTVIPPPKIFISDAERRTWEEGIDAFRREDYHNALAYFESLAESAENPSLSQKALYALACTRLILAQTPDEFSDALILWECWSKQAPSKDYEEDPRMITPFLERVTQPILVDAQSEKAAQTRKMIESKNILLYRSLQEYKNLLREREKEMDQLSRRLETKEKEIRRLRNQIDSLEAIHLKIQEKKKEASAP